MFDLFVEELAKASDRIKSGTRTKLKDEKLSAAQVHAAMGNLLKDPNIPAATKKQMQQIHKQLEGQVQKEYLEAQQKKANYKPLEIGAAASQRTNKEAATQAVIDQHLETHTPKQIKELGHADQYDQDVNSPKMRSRSAEKLTGGVKTRLGTGEGLAVRDKAYGQNLDLQRQMKDKEAKMKAARGPTEVIRVSGAPTVPDEHKDDAVISNLMKLRSTVSHPDHVAAVDDEIGKRVGVLSGNTIKKSLQESCAFNTGGQWLVKSK